MALHPKKLCELTGLQYDKKANTFWGTLQGYPVFLTVVPRRDTMIFRLIAKLPAEGAPSAVQEQLSAWMQEHSGISGLTHQDRCLSAALSLTPRKKEENAASAVAALVNLASNLSLQPCCMSCGIEYGYRPYLLDDGGVTVCDACRPHLEQKMEEAKAEMAAVQPNYGGILLAALLGAAAVFVLTYFVLKLSYLSVLTGYAGLFLGFYLMKKLGKKVTPAAAVLCTVLCLAAALTAPVLHFAGEMASYNRENEQTAVEICEGYRGLEDIVNSLSADELAELEEITGEKLDMEVYRARYEAAVLIRENLTTADCLQNFRSLVNIDIYSDLKPELIKCILFALLSVIGGAAVTAPSMIKADQGIHTLRELTA